MRLCVVNSILLVTVTSTVLCQCGIGAPRLNFLDSNGYKPEFEIFPWHVLIYRKESSRSQNQVCTGTLISSDTVISAAQCFYSDIQERKLEASDFIAVVGKHYRPYSWSGKDAQISGVQTIHLAKGYRGISGLYTKDIAWLVLQHSFNLTSSVQSIRIDSNNQYESEQLQSGKVGKALRWTKRLVGFPVLELQEVNLTYVPLIECDLTLPEHLRRYLTADKFCASVQNGRSFAIPDVGSGLHFQRNGRWYLRGVLSFVSLYDPVPTKNNLVMFTNVGRFIDEMNRNTAIQRCGIAEPPTFPLIVNGLRAKPSGSPWHVAIYKKNSSGFYEQICGGSLISSDVIISAAHCFYDDTIRQIQDTSGFEVAAGKLYRLYNWPERFVQRSLVETIHLPSRYYGFDGNFAEDIAWLILKQPFLLTAFVRPICIDPEKSHETEDLKIGRFGRVVGWGKTADGSPSTELQEIDLPFIPYEKCVAAFPRDFRPFVTGDKFCAGYTNGTSLCDGDSGGGLVFQRNGRWYLRGIVSVSPRIRDTCDTNSYTAFTNVGSFTDELYRFTNVMTHGTIEP